MANVVFLVWMAVRNANFSAVQGKCEAILSQKEVSLQDVEDMMDMYGKLGKAEQTRTGKDKA